MRGGGCRVVGGERSQAGVPGGFGTWKSSCNNCENSPSLSQPFLFNVSISICTISAADSGHVKAAALKYSIQSDCGTVGKMGLHKCLPVCSVPAFLDLWLLHFTIDFVRL